MSSSTIIPMFDPQGTLRDVPQEQVPDAIKAGGQPAVRFQAPDGTSRYVPASRTNEAVQSGGKIQPFEQQDVKHPGFWAGLGEDLLGMVKSAPMALAPPIAGLSKSIDEWKSFAATGKTTEQLHNEQQQAAGYPGWYRYLATPLAEGVGANVSGMEQSAQQGDFAGVAGHAAAVPTAIAATDAAVRAIPVVASNPTAVKVARTGATVAKTAADLADVVTFNRLNQAWNALKHGASDVSDIWQKPTATAQPQPIYPGAPLPSTPAPEQLNPALVSPARTLPGQVGKEVIGPWPKPAEPIPAREGLFLPAYNEPTVPTPAATEAELSAPRAINENRSLSGESALRQLLTGQDYQNLMKIAKSRGINVTQEAQLKPSVADSRLVGKIIDDFSPDELDELRDKYLETERFKHNFGDMPPEAWKTLSLQNYFPDVKIAQAILKRTQKAVAQNQPRSIVVDPQTGRPKFSDVVAAKQAPERTPAAMNTATDDLTEILQKSLEAAKAAQ